MKNKRMYEKAQYFICIRTDTDMVNFDAPVVQDNFYTKKEIIRMVNDRTSLSVIKDTFRPVWVISGFNGKGHRSGAKWCHRLGYDYRELLNK